MATLKDVARESQMSLPTVAQIINGHATNYSQATREKVLAAMREVGYRRNTQARNLVIGRTNIICLIIGCFHRFAAPRPEALISLSDMAHERQQQLHVIRVKADNILEDPCFQLILKERSCDGLVFDITLEREERALVESELARIALPAVWLNDDAPFNSVYPDETAAGKFLAGELLRHGHRHVFYLGLHVASKSLDFHFSRNKRLEALEGSFLANGGLSVVKFPCWENKEEFRGGVGDFLKNPGVVTAMVFYSAAYALTVAELAESLGVPFFRRFGLAAFDAYQGGVASTQLKIPSSVPDLPAMCAKAVEMLLWRVQNKGERAPSCQIPTLTQSNDHLMERH